MNTEKRRTEEEEMCFYMRTLRIPWAERASNEKVLSMMGTKMTLIRRIIKRQLKFLQHIKRNEGLEN